LGCLQAVQLAEARRLVRFEAQECKERKEAEERLQEQRLQELLVAAAASGAEATAAKHPIDTKLGGEIGQCYHLLTWSHYWPARIVSFLHQGL
jgi:hypothetical protein